MCSVLFGGFDFGVVFVCLFLNKKQIESLEQIIVLNASPVWVLMQQSVNTGMNLETACCS